ncbi:MAG TPA: alpha/beta hydrolase [Steroidobacteraceae bacterium]|nr:alpha/beta hydrolase [Steroidobacteraceae bacterium]
MNTLIDIGGRRLALNCTGAGTPTVILETGLGAESDEWAAVQEAVQTFTRVCRYDRAGRGASDPAVRRRSAAEMVEDLHVLLRTADIRGPYVLVGHSFGGLLMRLFAQRFPQEVRSLVLVDSMHEDQFEVFGPTFPPATAEDPSPLRAVRAFWTGGWRTPESTAEGIDFVASLAQGRAIESLYDLPIHVLTAGTFLNQPLVPAAHRKDLQNRWDALQARFLELSSTVTQTIVHRSGHFMQRNCPEVIVEAIAQAVGRSVRAGERSPEAVVVL